MTYTTKEEFETLHAVRIRGMAQPEGVAEGIGYSPDSVRVILDDAVARGLAKSRNGGRVQGYMLTADGRVRHDQLLAEHVTPGEREGLSEAYDAFLAPNRVFKAVTTKWQTEADGDITVVEADLLELHRIIGEVLSTAAAVAPRMKFYQPRFETALTAFRGGDTSALARPMSGSYHDVWMELHEDLLLSLNRARTEHDE